MCVTMMHWRVTSVWHAGLSAGMLMLPSALPDPGVTAQQNMTVPPVNAFFPGLQAPAQAAGGCSGTPQVRASPLHVLRKHPVSTSPDNPCTAGTTYLSLYSTIVTLGEPLLGLS